MRNAVGPATQTLKDCLAEFERPEALDANNQWKCPGCEEDV
jgi:ubiquitin C-terminal hydrolase